MESGYNYINKNTFTNNPGNPVNVIVVIPCFNEYRAVKRLLQSLMRQNKELLQKTMFVFVINNTMADSETVRNINAQTVEFFKEQLAESFPLWVTVIDQATKGNMFPDKTGGVGLARKIGMDESLKWFHSRDFRALVSLDADCQLGDDYLETIHTFFKDKKNQAAVLPYEHPLNVEGVMADAIVNYELYLRYYTLSLHYANSHYAFHTIGSTMAVTPDTYKKSGGMNKRKAAEDFYFLEKVRKIVPIASLKTGMVYPSPRISQRVPFGTGQRVKRYVEGEFEDENLLYNPKNFDVLKQWNAVFAEHQTQSGEMLLDKARQISPELSKYLFYNYFVPNWNNVISNSKDEKYLLSQRIMWMDAFRTMKLVHFLRDNLNPNIYMFDAIDELMAKFELPKIERGEGTPPYEKQVEYLTALRKAQIDLLQ